VADTVVDGSGTRAPDSLQLARFTSEVGPDKRVARSIRDESQIFFRAWHRDDNPVSARSNGDVEKKGEAFRRELPHVLEKTHRLARRAFIA
jgi:hypothetical protein